VTPRLVATTAAALALAAATARAHPHIWIDADAELRFADGRLVAIEQRWVFDEVFSDFILQEHDRDGDGRFDAEETEAVRREAFESLAELGWLTHLRLGEERIALPEARAFSVTAADGLVAYRFTLPLPEPADPSGGPVVLSLYDETYYIDILLADERAVRLAGAPDACRWTLFEDAANPIYFGMIHPQAVDVSCGAS
jgi:ABC-type uncharacterized transport system substrate-binding protein